MIAFSGDKYERRCISYLNVILLIEGHANKSLFCFDQKHRLMLLWQCGEGELQNTSTEIFHSKYSDDDAGDDDSADISQKDDDNELWDEQSARECGRLRHQV